MVLVNASTAWPCCGQSGIFVLALTLEKLLLQLGLGDLDFNGLVDLLGVTAAVVGVVLDGGAEEGVDEGGLSETRLSSYHDGKGGTTFGDDLVALVGELCAWSMAAHVVYRLFLGAGTYIGNANRRCCFGHDGDVGLVARAVGRDGRVEGLQEGTRSAAVVAIEVCRETHVSRDVVVACAAASMGGGW